MKDYHSSLIGLQNIISSFEDGGRVFPLFFGGGKRNQDPCHKSRRHRRAHWLRETDGVARSAGSVSQETSLGPRTELGMGDEPVVGLHCQSGRSSQGKGRGLGRSQSGKFGVAHGTLHQASRFYG